MHQSPSNYYYYHYYHYYLIINPSIALSLVCTKCNYHTVVIYLNYYYKSFSILLHKIQRPNWQSQFSKAIVLRGQVLFLYQLSNHGKYHRTHYALVPCNGPLVRAAVIRIIDPRPSCRGRDAAALLARRATGAGFVDLPPRFAGGGLGRFCEKKDGKVRDCAQSRSYTDTRGRYRGHVHKLIYTAKAITDPCNYKMHR